MSQIVLNIGMLLGGLGLFMLAVGIISDGLRLAAGKTLRHILGRWTRSPLHGLASGIAITGIVQSSSAVTVATIGFVNSGLMTLYQSLGVVFGANVGTTMTGWLVAMIGFKLKIELFALPLIGIGMFVRLLAGQRRIAHLGWALVGFGLFFIGIDVLRQAFEGFASGIDFQQLSSDGPQALLLFLAVGFLITVLTQSSSAAIAIILTAAGGGIIDLNDAAAMVIGANLGTTSTAVIAVVGATPNAKRVAAAHVFFNVITAIVALIILPFIFWLISLAGDVFSLKNTPEVTLALFHTVFNILGVVIIWPMLVWLSAFLEKRFMTHQEIESKPKYIDKNVAVSPSLALNALTLEIDRIVGMSKSLIKAVLGQTKGTTLLLNEKYEALEKLANITGEFISKLEKGTLTSEVKTQLSTLILAQQYSLSCAESALEIAKDQTLLQATSDSHVSSTLEDYLAEMRGVVGQISEQSLPTQDTDFDDNIQHIKNRYDEVKAIMLNAAVESRAPIQTMMEVMDNIKKVQLMTEQYCKANYQLNKVKTYLMS